MHITYRRNIMSLVNKSEFNLHGAQVLIDEECYCSSVHCSYYSCLQRVKHLLETRYGITDSTISIKKGERGSHDYMRATLSERIANPEYHTMFESYFNDLKTLRVKADYSNDDIIPDQAKKAHEKANELIKILKKL